MGLKDKLSDAYKAQDLRSKQAKAAKSQARVESGILLELSSIDKKVAFYGDRITLSNRTGSKRETIPYSQIRAVRLNKHSSAGKATAAFLTGGMSLAVTNKKVLHIETGPSNLSLDFRAESPARIMQAYEILNAGIAQSGSLVVVVAPTTQAPVSTSTSKADELRKLAELRTEGILSEEELQSEKDRLLGSS